MHDALTIGIPLIAIFAGILLNRQDVQSLRSDLRGEISSLRSEINGRLDSIQRDQREFYAEQTRHELRITALEQQK